MTQIWALRYRQSGSGPPLKNSQLTSGKIPLIPGTGHKGLAAAPLGSIDLFF
jgi:hypothetical protein